METRTDVKTMTMKQKAEEYSKLATANAELQTEYNKAPVLNGFLSVLGLTTPLSVVLQNKQRQDE